MYIIYACYIHNIVGTFGYQMSRYRNIGRYAKHNGNGNIMHICGKGGKRLGKVDLLIMSI